MEVTDTNGEPLQLFFFNSQSSTSFVSGCSSSSPFTPAAVISGSSCYQLHFASSSSTIEVVCASQAVCVADVAMAPMCYLSSPYVEIGITGVVIFVVIFVTAVIFFARLTRTKSVRLNRDVVIPVVGVILSALLQIIYWSLFIAQGQILRFLAPSSVHRLLNFLLVVTFLPEHFEIFKSRWFGCLAVICFSWCVCISFSSINGSVRIISANENL